MRTAEKTIKVLTAFINDQRINTENLKTMFERVATKDELEKATKDLEVNISAKNLAEMQKELQSLTESIDGFDDDDDDYK